MQRQQNRAKLISANVMKRGDQNGMIWRRRGNEGSGKYQSMTLNDDGGAKISDQ